ncbi:hypothetical protein AAG906_016077 [Vitis piasezkii]
MSLMKLYFPDEIDEHGTFAEIGVIVDGVAEEIYTAPALEFSVGDVVVVDDLFEGLVGLVKGVFDFMNPPLSFDVLSRFVSHSDDIFDIDYEIAQHDLDDDSSFVFYPSPIDQRVSLGIGDTKIVDFVVANIVPIPKKDDKVRVCVDFRDLNKANPKDDFLLPHINMLVDSTTGHSILSFMDGFSEYIQILMAPEDMEKTSFITEWGTYYYQVMSFRLKNAETTYQRTTTILFHDMMHRDVEIVQIETKSQEVYFWSDFWEAVGREIRGFLGGLQYIIKFIARLTDICEPIFQLLRKSQPTVWDDQCQRIFERIREYLLSLPVLVPPTPGRPLLLYLSISYIALDCILAYKRMLDYETRYVMIECYHLALVWATRRLRHYMTEYSVHLISRLDPLRYLFDRPALVGRLLRWLVLLTEIDIHYVTQKCIRGSIVADHLASLQVSDGRAIDDDFPNEDFAVVTSLSGWRMYFDGVTNHSIYRIETTLELGIRHMEVFGDSNMVLRQIQGEWKARDMKLSPYHAYLELLISRFDDLSYTHLPRAQNQFADVLATLASMIDIPTNTVVFPLSIESRSFLRLGAYLKAATTKDKRALRQLDTRFVICGETLYIRSVDGMLLLCLDHVFTDRVMREVHAGVCGPHMGRHMLALWGIDIIGKISPKSSIGHEFILVAIDYFTKWVEAASYARLTSSGVASFIISHIICHFRVLHELILDKGTSRDWSEKLPFALWAYWTSFRTSIGATPNSLVYGMEAVLPVEIDMGSLRRKMAHAFKKWVKPRPLQRGDLVLKVIKGLIRDPRGKFRPNWSKPYFIRELTLEGAAWLMDLDGN